MGCPVAPARQIRPKRRRGQRAASRSRGPRQRAPLAPRVGYAHGLVGEVAFEQPRGTRPDCGAGCPQRSRPWV